MDEMQENTSGINENFGKSLKAIRIYNGWSQEELAKKLHTTKQVISKYENSQRSPNVYVAKRYADILGVSLISMLLPDGERLPPNIVDVNDLTTHRIPVVGSVAAGEPIYDEEYDAYVDGPLKADCALKVKGESMVPTFQDGDLLYVRIQPDVDYDGQVAAVIVGEEATVKHVYRQEEGLMLLSDNPKYPPMFKRYADYDNQIRVLGKVIGFTRLWE